MNRGAMVLLLAVIAGCLQIYPVGGGQLSGAGASDGTSLDAAATDIAFAGDCGARQIYLADACTTACTLTSCAPSQWCALGTAMACTAVQCELPAFVKPKPVWKVTAVNLLEAGSGCDLDGNGSTDNGMAALLAEGIAPVAKTLQLAIATGEVVRVFDPGAAVQGIALFDLPWMQGVLAPKAKACNPTAPTGACELWLRKQAFALGTPGVCHPATVCEAVWNEKQLQITCSTMGQPVATQPQRELTGHNVTLTGPVAKDGQGTLRMCGSLRPAEVRAVLQGIPVDLVAHAGLPPDYIALFDQWAVADFDADHDGKADSISFAADVTLAPATVTGVAP